jgi:DNA invertase Pin-like site-specific DNA recombinase
LDAQRAACAAYVAQRETWALVEARYDDDGFSGMNLNRPAFRRLLVDIEAGKIDVVVVRDLSRLSRSREDLAMLVDRFEGSSVAFVLAAENVTIAGATRGVPAFSAPPPWGCRARRRRT